MHVKPEHMDTWTHPPFSTPSVFPTPPIPLSSSRKGNKCAKSVPCVSATQPLPHPLTSLLDVIPQECQTPQMIRAPMMSRTCLQNRSKLQQTEVLLRPLMSRYLPATQLALVAVPFGTRRIGNLMTSTGQ